MPADRLPLGIFTTDERLVVRTWDAWIAEATGVSAAGALGRPLAEVMPEVESRGHLDILQDVVARGKVAILSSALHRYLFACPPAAPSTMFDRMQQHVTVGPLREDGRIIGLVVTVEDVTARRERERQVTAQLDTPADAGEPGGGSRREIESLTSLLGEPDWRVRRMAVTTLAEHGDAVVDALVRTLRQQHDNVSVLSGALDLLAISDIDIIEPLVRFLEDDDPNLRLQAALILGERRDRRAVAPLIAHLADQDVNVVFHVIEALGRLSATEAADHLIAIAETRDFFLAFPAIQALSRLGTPSLAPRLVPLLADELLRPPVIEALGELGDEDVAAPLVNLLDTSEAPTEVVTDALAGLYQRYESRYGAGDLIATLVRRHITAAATQRILDAVQRVDAERLPGLARVLGWLEGDAVQRALTRLLGRGTVRAQVVEALVRNGSGVVALLGEQLRAEDLETRQAAAVALGRIGDRRATPALIHALGDRELAVAAAGALASIGDGSAFEPLLDRLRDPSPAIRQAAIAALNSIGHPDMPQRIAPMLDDPDPNVREAALKIAGYFGYPACLDRVLACSADAADSVRRTAAEQLAFFEEPRAGERLLQMAGDPAAPVRAAVAAALARVDHPARVEALLRGVDDPDSWVRYVTMKAFAAVRADRVLPAVLARLENDPAPHVRLAAVDIVGRLAPDNALDILEPLVRSSNDDIARAAIGGLSHVGRPEALTVLEQEARAQESWRRLAAIDALAARTEAQLAETFQWIAAADSDPEVAAAAVAALGKLGSRQDRAAADATRALINLTSEAALRGEAIVALASLPSRRIADIRSGLQHSSPAVRCAVVEALSRMMHPDASRGVEAALDDAAVPVRLAAVAELKHLGARTSLRKLMQVAHADPAAEVRQAAVMAIARTGGTESRGGAPRQVSS